MLEGQGTRFVAGVADRIGTLDGGENQAWRLASQVLLASSGAADALAREVAAEVLAVVRVRLERPLLVKITVDKAKFLMQTVMHGRA